MLWADDVFPPGQGFWWYRRYSTTTCTVHWTGTLVQIAIYLCWYRTNSPYQYALFLASGNHPKAFLLTIFLFFANIVRILGILSDKNWRPHVTPKLLPLHFLILHGRISSWFLTVASSYLVASARAALVQMPRKKAVVKPVPSVSDL